METTMVGRRERSRETESAESLTLEYRADGRLWARRGGCGETRPVWVRRCFPWSEPERFLSLRDDDDREFAHVIDAAALDLDSRTALAAALVAAGFVFAVTRVVEIEEEVEIRYWRVETRQGARTFATRLDDWPRALPGGGLLIRDVAGDLSHLADPAAMDKHSRDLLWAFVD